MANFMEFIRYGLPGYWFLASILFGLYHRGELPKEDKFYSDYGTILGALVIVVGPLVGFIIHQLYILYFDLKESYTKLNRGCLKTLYDYYLHQDTSFPITDKKTRGKLEKGCYISWKFIMTGMDEKFKVSSLFLTRLTSLRNYSHAFGGIVTSCLLSLIVFTMLTIRVTSQQNVGASYFFLFFTIFLMLLFGYKRHELTLRINELENGVMMLKLKEFSEFLTVYLNNQKSLEIRNLEKSTINNKKQSLEEKKITEKNIESQPKNRKKG